MQAAVRTKLTCMAARWVVVGVGQALSQLLATVKQAQLMGSGQHVKAECAHAGKGVLLTS